MSKRGTDLLSNIKLNVHKLVYAGIDELLEALKTDQLEPVTVLQAYQVPRD